MKVLVLGDTHCNVAAMRRAFEVASNHGADAILQVGDFGYWPKRGGQKFLHQTVKFAGKYKVPVYWVDGNHEEFDSLLANYGRDPVGPVQVKPLIYWLPRGTVFDWDGVRFLAMGGAASIDRGWRILGQSWFLEEMISDADVERAVPADIVVAHDAPLNPLSAAGKRFIVNDDSEFCRQQMRRVVNIAQPDLLLHGHYHMYSDLEYMRENGYTRVVGLDCDGTTDNMAMLTLDNGKWELVAPFHA